MIVEGKTSLLIQRPQRAQCKAIEQLSKHGFESKRHPALIFRTVFLYQAHTFLKAWLLYSLGLGIYRRKPSRDTSASVR
jgi:hypothetical protein